MEVIIGGKGAPPPPKKQPNLLVRLLAFLLTLALMLGAVALVAHRDKLNFDAQKKCMSPSAPNRGRGPGPPRRTQGRTGRRTPRRDGRGSPTAWTAPTAPQRTTPPTGAALWATTPF